MRIQLVIILLAQSVFGASVLTNIGGLVLGLEFPSTTVVAGEKLAGSIVVSNPTTASKRIGFFNQRGYWDTSIGDFVVTDETGYVLPKTVPFYELFSKGSGGTTLFPGQDARFDGDVVWGYSLTNPGNYLVRAIARVPAPTGGGSVMIEIPPVEITVTPRPEGSPPPKPLYKAPPSGMSDEDVRKATEEALRGFAPIPKPERLPKLDSTPRTDTLPNSVRERITNTASAVAPSIPRHNTKLVYVMLLLGACATVLWRLLRKKSQ